MPDRDTVDRVARAICAAEFAGSSRGSWQRLTGEQMDMYRRMARAAIEAAKGGRPAKKGHTP